MTNIPPRKVYILWAVYSIIYIYDNHRMILLESIQMGKVRYEFPVPQPSLTFGGQAVYQITSPIICNL